MSSLGSSRSIRIHSLVPCKLGPLKCWKTTTTQLAVTACKCLTKCGHYEYTLSSDLVSGNFEYSSIQAGRPRSDRSSFKTLVTCTHLRLNYKLQWRPIHWTKSVHGGWSPVCLASNKTSQYRVIIANILRTLTLSKVAAEQNIYFHELAVIRESLCARITKATHRLLACDRERNRVFNLTKVDVGLDWRKLNIQDNSAKTGLWKRRTARSCMYF